MHDSHASLIIGILIFADNELYCRALAQDI